MVYESVVPVQILCLYYYIVNAKCFWFYILNMSTQYYLANDLLLYYAQYCGASINPKLVISNWFGLTEKMNKIFRTGVVCVFWKKAGVLLRINVEMIQNRAR